MGGWMSQHFWFSYALSVECLDMCWACPTGQKMVIIVVMPHRDFTAVETNTKPPSSLERRPASPSPSKSLEGGQLHRGCEVPRSPGRTAGGSVVRSKQARPQPLAPDPWPEPSWVQAHCLPGCSGDANSSRTMHPSAPALTPGRRGNRVHTQVGGTERNPCAEIQRRAHCHSSEVCGSSPIINRAARL